MAFIFITAMYKNMPDAENLFGWDVIDGTADFYIRSVNNHVLVAHPCIEEVGKKVLIKQNILASWIEFVKIYFSQHYSDFKDADLYVIAHDKDLLPRTCVKEGLFRSSSIEKRSKLVGMILDKHIYVFPHIPRKPMFSALISKMLEDLSEEQIDSVIQLIENEASHT